ncbi:hypothetical protein [Comamonas sp. C24C]
MTTCITCQHWHPKDTSPAMVRMGFAQCEKKTKGHTLSANAPACDRHKPVDEATAQKRVSFIKSKEAA